MFAGNGFAAKYGRERAAGMAGGGERACVINGRQTGGGERACVINGWQTGGGERACVINGWQTGGGGEIGERGGIAASYFDPVVAGVVQGRRDFLKIGRDIFAFNQPVVQLVPVSGREVVIAVVAVEEQNLGYLVFQEQGNNRPVVGSLQKVVGINQSGAVAVVGRTDGIDAAEPDVSGAQKVVGNERAAGVSDVLAEGGRKYGRFFLVQGIDVKRQENELLKNQNPSPSAQTEAGNSRLCRRA